MITLHLENTISDYTAWKAAFDRYGRARHEHNVRAYRVSRSADDAGTVYIDLDFEKRDDATRFVELLEKIWQTPVSRSVLIGHATPELRELTEHETLGAAV